MTKTSEKGRKKWTAGAVVIAGLFHLIGVTLVFTALVALSMPLQTALGAVGFAMENGMGDAVVFRLVIQLGLAGCLWTMGALLFSYLDLGRLAKRTPRVVKRAKGTVITETIIVLPVLMLLIFGMFQMSLNNMTAILHKVAEFQATRTAWVWHQEGIDEEELKDRVRISVALVMAPTAPGAFPGYERNAALTPRAEQTRDLMEARFMLFPMSIADALGLSTVPGERLQVAAGLDGSASNGERARTKFTHAYRSTEIIDVHFPAEGEQGMVYAEYTYHYFQAMPLVGALFGESMGTNTYFQPHESDYRLPAQVYYVGRP